MTNSVRTRTEGDDSPIGFCDSEGLGVVVDDGGGRWNFVRFDDDRLGVVNIMILCDALSVEF